MARGFFAGVLSGAVVGGLGLAILSIVTGPVETGPVGKDATSAQAVGAAEQPPAAEGAQQAAGDGSASAVPAEAAEPTDPVAPNEGGDTPAAPVDPVKEPPSDVPEQAAPQEEGAAPDDAAAPATSAPEVDQGGDLAMGGAPEPDRQPDVAPDDAPVTPLVPVRPAAPQVEPGSARPASGPAPSPLPGGAGQEPAAPVSAAVPDEPVPGLEAEGAGARAAMPQVPAEPTLTAVVPERPQEGVPPEPAPVTGDPVAPVGDGTPNVITDRLPSIGGAEGGKAAEPSEAVGAERAINRNAAPFARPEAVPLMSVLLRDVPAERGALGDLAGLPFPVSFVVEATQPDAAEAVAFYRGAGAEVLLALDLPEGATAADVEVSMQALAALMEPVVGVQIGAGFQIAGPAARQVAQILSEGGYGLVSVPQGLNTGHKLAIKAGVPAGLVFRELDHDGQSPAVIRRFLDNAAFKARQAPGVILLGHARAGTLQALMEWSLGNRVKTVAMAPVSAVLLGD